MIDLHRHDEFSSFDGFGKPVELAAFAKQLGYKALGTSNHGNVSGLVEHYYACKDVGIKPVMGVEAYFQPKFDKDKPRYHICLFVKSLIGYRNLNTLMAEANIEKFYYKPIVDFELLEKYSEGLICTSGCIAGPFTAAIKNGKQSALKLLNKFVDIFGDDFYIEIQPYKLREKGLQEMQNKRLMQLAEASNVKCILTSDSHYGAEKDFDTYLKMHEISGTKYDVGETYYERYMPSVDDLKNRFVSMHSPSINGEADWSIEATQVKASRMYKNLEELVSKVDDEILEKLELNVPVIGTDSKQKLKQEIMNGLKAKGKFNKKYIERCKQEYEVLIYHGFEDYFLIVQDYVKWAKEQGIKVGPGRGSVCNCEIAYALGITDVDSIYFGLDFTRFLRKDKKKLPDIDLDFETDRRHEVIDYIVNKYEGKAVQICSYGLYKVDNLLNDLFKVCGVEDSHDKASIKSHVKNFLNEEGTLDKDAILQDKHTAFLNKSFDNILKHFVMMYKKIRFLGTHAAGVVIVGTNLYDYVSVRRVDNGLTSVYDLNNLEKINAIKFDILGLKTMSIIKELEEATGESFDYSWLEDQRVLDNFKAANTDGIFQFEKKAARNILTSISADCIEDIVAANSLNRPGPLSLRTPERYAENKKNIDLVKNSRYYEYTKETYGTIVYQEQITAICRGIGKMSWSDSDKVLKHLKGVHNITEQAILSHKQNGEYLIGEFIKGATENGLTKEEAADIFDKITTYSFNKGHAVGYSLISLQQMYYKLYHPLEFWYITLKYADEKEIPRLSIEAVKEGNVIMLPHVNYDVRYSIQKFDGDKAICAGISDIKNVGQKAAEAIITERKTNGRYKNMDDFLDRIEPYKRIVNKRVIDALKESGALEFDKRVYISRVIKYNSSMYGRPNKN